MIINGRRRRNGKRTWRKKSEMKEITIIKRAKQKRREAAKEENGNEKSTIKEMRMKNDKKRERKETLK